MSHAAVNIRSQAVAAARVANSILTVTPLAESSLSEVGVDAYLEGLAQASEHLRAMHGGKQRWWINHDRQACEYCSRQAKFARAS